MKSKASLAIAVFRRSFLPKLTLARFGQRYDVVESTAQRIEAGVRFPGADLISGISTDGVAHAGDWYENIPDEDQDSVTHQVVCQKCDRRWVDPEVRACLNSDCPRANWPEEQKATARNAAQSERA